MNVLWSFLVGTGLSVSGPTVGRKGQDAERPEEVGLFGTLALGARVAASCDMAVADLGHPAGTCQVAFHRLVSPLRLLGGIDAENEPGHFVLADALSIGVEKA